MNEEALKQLAQSEHFETLKTWIEDEISKLSNAFSVDTNRPPEEVVINLRARQYTALIFREMLRKLENLREGERVVAFSPQDFV